MTNRFSPFALPELPDKFLLASSLVASLVMSFVGLSMAQSSSSLFSGGFTLAGPSSSPGTLLTGAYSADIDNDGDSDILGISDTGIAWYRNGDSNGDGDGSLWSGYLIDTISFSRGSTRFGSDALVAADIDNDGDLDAVAASDILDAVLLYRNGDGNGGGDGSTWTRVEVNPSLQNPSSVHASDIDGDGDIDILSGSELEVAWYRNGDARGGGDGSTWTETTIATRANDPSVGITRSVHGTDIDGDGDTDVLSAFQNVVALYRNGDTGGGGSGLSWTRVDIAVLADGPKSVHAGDVDGDGDTDVLSSLDDGNGRIVWHRNGDMSGMGDGSSWTLIEIGLTGEVLDNFAHAVRPGDIDGDGDLDVVSNTTGEVVWHQNGGSIGNGDGSSWSSIPILNASTMAGSALALGDVDGDGDLDTISNRSDFNDNISWFRNGDASGTGDGFSWTPLEVAEPAYAVQSLYASDVDGDGDVDVLSAPYEDQKIAWYQNGDSERHEGVFPWINTEIAKSGLLAQFATDVHAGDFDGDGDLDAVFAFALQGRIAWYRNDDGSGSSWTQITITTSATTARGVHAADIDGDGDLDVVSASSGVDKIVWYRNGDSSGGSNGLSWTPLEITTTASGAWDVYTADIDKDGDTDILSASEGDDTIAWYRNGDSNGGGDGSSWAPITISSDAVQARSVTAGDMDGDGDLDVLSASYADDTVAWYRNGDSAGGGEGSTWTPIIVASDANGASSVDVADMDGDGDLDILATEALGNQVALYINGDSNGDGDGSSWFERELNLVAEGASSVFAADADGDGDLDVFYASEEDDAIALLENQKITEAPTASYSEFVFGSGLIPFNPTGVAINFGDGTAGSGNVTVSRLSSPPNGIAGVPDDAAVSAYRVIINAEAGLTFGSGTAVRFNASQFDGIAFPADVEVYARPSINFGTFSPLPTEHLSDTNEISAVVTGFSEFIFVSDNSENPLPVELANWAATLEGPHAVLEWQTTSETNNAGFEIERWERSGTWMRLGRVSGSGTTSEPQVYRFRDTALPYEADSLTYRLRQIDLDGTATYSDEVTLVRSAVETLELLGTFPNPVRSRVTVQFALPAREAEGGGMLHLYDLIGRRVRQVDLGRITGRHELQINVSDLAAGMYLLRLTAGNEIRTQRLTIVR